MICRTPAPPYYAVIFPSILSESLEDYDKVSQLTEEKAKTIPGYLGNEYFRNAEGFGIHISYWKNQDAIEHWRKDTLHQAAKRKGMEEWYEAYQLRICKVEHQSSQF